MGSALDDAGILSGARPSVRAQPARGRVPEVTAAILLVPAPDPEAGSGEETGATSFPDGVLGIVVEDAPDDVSVGVGGVGLPTFRGSAGCLGCVSMHNDHHKQARTRNG